MAHNQLATKRLMIQEITPMDFDFLQTLYEDKKNYDFATGVSSNHSLHLQNMLNDLAKQNEQFFCVAKKKNSGRAVGCIKWQIRPNEGVVWISMLIVVISEQQKGYGQEILECFCAYWKSYFDSKTILISVDGENKKGLQFWYKMGFEKKQVRQKTKNDETGSVSGFQQIIILEKVLK